MGPVILRVAHTPRIKLSSLPVLAGIEDHAMGLKNFNMAILPSLIGSKNTHFLVTSHTEILGRKTPIFCDQLYVESLTALVTHTNGLLV